MKLFFPKKKINLELTNALSQAHDGPDLGRETFGPIY